METQAKFTVFVDWAGSPDAYYSGYLNAPSELAPLLAWIPTANYVKAVAWAPGLPCDDGYDEATLRAESIAAGRVIEKVDGVWVARGVEEKPGAEESELPELVKHFNQREQAEPQRAPLDWAKPVKFDPFKGKFDDWNCVSVTHTQDSSKGHPLTRTNACGLRDHLVSAHLLKG